VEAFTNLDGVDFRGFKLRVSFARSSIVTEDVYKKQCNNDRFNFTVNTRRQDAGQHFVYCILWPFVGIYYCKNLLVSKISEIQNNIVKVR